jgi:hypothetical protein
LLLRRNFIWRGFFVAVICCPVATRAQTDLKLLESTFQSPPDDARVMMRWWWFGPAVTKPELAREMEQMKAGGFGGFEIQPVYALDLDDPKRGFRNLPYLSDEFLDDVRFVNNKARKLGLRVSLTLSSGWPYGGPHTPVTESASALRLIQTAIGKGDESVPVPDLANGESLIGVFLADANWEAKESGEPRVLLPLPRKDSLRFQLTTASTADRKLLWFVSSRTGQQVKRAAIDADGFVLDHFSREAVDDHLHNVADKLMTAFGDGPPYSVFSDSLEVYGADWTPDFLEQFQHRRGYDLLPHLPELFSSHPNEESLAVRHDWGKTLTELIDENYLGPINRWAAAHHTLFRSQTYGDPAVSLSSNALVDLPEGEGPQWQQFSYTRWATSASHVYGRPVTSSETWTWLHSPVFRATPLDMKAEADRFFLQGVNQLIGHGWPYSPPSIVEPGWRFYAAGVFNEHNPWWIVMPDVASYLQRTSWVLRQGQPSNDVAMFLPEDDAYSAFTRGKVSLSDLMPQWITPALTQAIEKSGYNFDYIDSAAIAARGIHYPVLILPNVDRISTLTIAKISQYLEGGGMVIALGRLPAHATEFLDDARASEKVAADVRALFDESSSAHKAMYIADVSHLQRALSKMLPADLQLSTPAPEVGFIHRKLVDADVYFIANTGNEPVDTRVTFRANHQFGECLDADTGHSFAVKMEDHGFNLRLAAYQSRILLLHDDVSLRHAASDQGSARENSDVVSDLSTHWKIKFGANGEEEDMPNLDSWTRMPGRLYFSGVATYRRTIVLSSKELNGKRLFLEFGVGKSLPEATENVNHPGMQALLDPPIRDAAVIYINGKRAGSLWHPPYELEITSQIKPGRNEIEVHVANTAINLLAGQSLPEYRLLSARYGRRFVPQDLDHLQPLPSGLLGRVELIGRTQ